MKNKIIGLGVLVAGVIALASCNNANGNSTTPGSITQQKSDVGYQLVTSSALSQTSAAPARSLVKAASSIAPAVSTETDVVPLLQQLDLFASNNNDKITVQSEPSDRQDYDFLDKVTYIGLSGESQTMSMYYKTTGTSVETDDDDRNSQEQEIETRMEGVVVIGEGESAVENAFYALTEVETETGESEESLSTRIYTSADKRSYINSVRKNEQEGTETELTYAYEVYENGNLTESFSYDFEVEEDGKEEIDIKFSDGNFRVKMETENGKQYIRVTDSTGASKRYEKVEQADGSVTFQEVAAQ